MSGSNDGNRFCFQEFQNTRAKLIENDYTANRRKSGERLKYSLVHLRETFGSSRALSITTARVKEYIAERLKAKATPGTIRCELAALKRMFALAMQAGMLAQVPYIPSLQVSNARQGFFEQPQLDAVLAQLPEVSGPRSSTRP